MSIDQLAAALADRYTIERELGGGGMSRVFVATETALNRSIVIKVIAPALLDGMSIDRFAREVRLAARLQHANIVPVLAAGDADGTPYYTMPFVRGDSLRSRMATGAPVPLSDAVHVLRDVARALAYAHGEGVVHRDIKPENILLSGGAAVVTDFGIAKAIDISRTQDGDHNSAVSVTLTQAGSSLGTPAYMAPEQATGDPDIDHRADIYAWGMVAWEVLAGRHPFAGKTSLQATIAAQITDTPAPLVSVRPEVPAALSQLVQSCLQKDPDRRPSAASELLEALDLAFSTGARTAPAVRARARPGRAAAAGLGIALIAVAAWAVKGRNGHGGSAVIDKSLAVIPFTSMSSDTGDAYLGEGIADEVTNTLSVVPGLRLAGRSSAARAAQKGATPQEIGTSLRVNSILDGTVRRFGDQIRITAELSNASDGRVIWHENYERAAKDIFGVQDEIARAIAGRLQVTLSGAGRQSLAASGTRDATAYDLYLKGIYLYRRRGVGITDAIATLEQSVARDSMFARAWAGLAMSLAVSPSYVNSRDADVLPSAHADAERAVRLDSMLSDAHLALGYVDTEQFQWQAAETELRRAIALDPTASEPRYRLGYALVNQGRPTEAIPELEQGEALDPLYFLTAVYLGWAKSQIGRDAEGVSDIRRGLDLEPSSVATLGILALAYDRAGEHDSALNFARRIAPLSSQASRLGVAAYVLARNGDRGGADALVHQLEATPPTQWTRWTGLALAYLGMGDTARTIYAMEHAASGDGDAFPLYGSSVATGLPLSPRVGAVWRWFHIDPARFTGRNRPGAP